jgi:hypothetical protein
MFTPSSNGLFYPDHQDKWTNTMGNKLPAVKSSIISSSMALQPKADLGLLDS